MRHSWSRGPVSKVGSWHRTDLPTLLSDETSEDQQQACGNAEPPAGRLAQEAHGCSKRGWQAIDELRQAVIIVSRFV